MLLFLTGHRVELAPCGAKEEKSEALSQTDRHPTGAASNMTVWLNRAAGASWGGVNKANWQHILHSQ